MDRLPRGPELWAPEQSRWTAEATDGIWLLEFGEAMMTHTKGAEAGLPVRWRAWQADIVCELFRLRDDGRRQYRGGLLGMGRKNGKSLLGSALALAGLFDEPGAEVYSAAADKEQARIVFREAQRMVEQSAELSRRLKVYKDVIEEPGSGSIYRVLSSEAFTKEGLNVSRAIIDEVHALPNRELWDVLSLGSGTRRNPLVLGITTAGARYDSSGRESLCYQLYQYGRRIASGELEDDSFFFRWYEPANPSADHKDPDTWAEANPALGDYLDPEDLEALVRRTPEPEFRAKRCNMWVESIESWLPHGAWDDRETGRRLEPGETVVLGFDGSYTGDSTALVACSLDGHLEVVGAWEKPDGVTDWKVDIAEVEATITAACRRYKVLEVACDPFRWQRSMQALAAEGVPILEYATGSASKMTGATQKMFEAVRDGRVTHDGDPRLARHVANCRLRVDNLGQRISKEHKHSQRRIDLAVAAVVAFDRATQAPEPPLPIPKIHVW